MDNLMISWWLMHRGKLTVSCELWTTDWYCGDYCTVENLLNRVNRQQTLCVVWKTYWTVNGVENLLNRVWCEKLTEPCEPSTDIVCDVENLLNRVNCQQTLCVVWKTYWTVCGVRNLLTSSWLMYRGKLTHKNTLRKHDIDIIVYCGQLTVKNLLTKIRYGNMILTSSCTVDNLLWKIYSHHHVLWKTYRGKLIHIIRFLNMIWVFYLQPFTFLLFPLLLFIILIYSSIMYYGKLTILVCTIIYLSDKPH